MDAAETAGRHTDARTDRRMDRQTHGGKIRESNGWLLINFSWSLTFVVSERKWWKGRRQWNPSTPVCTSQRRWRFPNTAESNGPVSYQGHRLYFPSDLTYCGSTLESIWIGNASFLSDIFPWVIRSLPKHNDRAHTIEADRGILM